MKRKVRSNFKQLSLLGVGKLSTHLKWSKVMPIKEQTPAAAIFSKHQRRDWLSKSTLQRDHHPLLWLDCLTLTQIKIWKRKGRITLLSKSLIKMLGPLLSTRVKQTMSLRTVKQSQHLNCFSCLNCQVWHLSLCQEEPTVVAVETLKEARLWDLLISKIWRAIRMEVKVLVAGIANLSRININRTFNFGNLYPLKSMNSMGIKRTDMMTKNYLTERILKIKK